MAEGLLGIAWVGPLRHFPSAGVFYCRFGASFRLLPSAAVRAKMRGREATPQGGRSPPIYGREATLWLQGVPLYSSVFPA